MGSSLYWKPEMKRTGKCLPDELKHALEKGFVMDSEGRVFTSEDRSYLTALVHQGVKGADELIDLIDKHEEIRLWLEY